MIKKNKLKFNFHIFETNKIFSSHSFKIIQMIINHKLTSVLSFNPNINKERKINSRKIWKIKFKSIKITFYIIKWNIIIIYIYTLTNSWWPETAEPMVVAEKERKRQRRSEREGETKWETERERDGDKVRQRETEWDKVTRRWKNGGRRGLFSVRVIDMTKSYLFSQNDPISFSG